MRSIASSVVCFTIVTIGLYASGSVAAEDRLPNIVFILADDLGWADTTLYGHTKFYHTPNVERLARPDWREDRPLLQAVNVQGGEVIHPALKEALD